MLNTSTQLRYTKIRVSETLKKSYLDISRQVFRPFSFHLPCINILSTRIVPYHFMYIEIVKLLQRRNSNRRAISNYWLRWSLMTRQPHNRVIRPFRKQKHDLVSTKSRFSRIILNYMSPRLVVFRKKVKKKKTTVNEAYRNVQEPREMLGMCTHKLRCNCATPTVRKQKEPDTRTQESGCDDFFIKLWKTSKMLRDIYSLVQLNERNSIFFRSLYTICIDNILPMKITIHNHAK